MRLVLTIALCFQVISFVNTCTAEPLQNVLNDPGTHVTSEIAFAGGNGPDDGGLESVLDGDLQTAWHRGFRNQSTGGGGNIDMSVIYEFSNPKILQEIIVRSRVQSGIDGTTDRSQRGKIGLYYAIGDGDFQLLPDSLRSYGPDGSGDRAIELNEHFKNLNLPDVTKVLLRGEVNAFANNSSQTNGSAIGDIFHFELQVLAVPEPASILLLALALPFLAGATRLRNRHLRDA